MEKVLLTKEVAEALESALEHSEKKADIIENHVSGLWSGKRKPLHGLSLEKLAVALFIGYTVEPSPEEKVRNYFFSLKQNQEENQQKLTGLMTTLNLLGKKIEGVNC